MNLTDLDLDVRKSKLLMELAYDSIIEDMHERIERVVRYHYGIKDIKKPFLHPTLWGLPISMPKQNFWRKARSDVWGKRGELLEKEYKMDVERLAELVPIVEELERWFAAEKEKTIDANVNAFLGSIKKPKRR